MRHEIVVASYKEDLSWTDFWKAGNDAINILPDTKLTIYRAGQDLKNRGREASQWLHHIVKNYENLADFTFFVQADLGACYGRPSQVWPYDLNALKGFRPPPHDGFFILPSMEPIKKAGPANHKGHGYNSVDSKNISLMWGFVPKEFRWADIFSMAFLGAQHVVSKDIILALPRTYYEGILLLASDSFAHWAEYGKWPAVIYDLFKQREAGVTHEWVPVSDTVALMPKGEDGVQLMAKAKQTEAEQRECLKVGSNVPS